MSIWGREARQCEIASRWLHRDTAWLDELSGVWFNGGLTDEDRDWLADMLEAADMPVPTVDTSWIRMEWIR